MHGRIYGSGVSEHIYLLRSPVTKHAWFSLFLLQFPKTRVHLLFITLLTPTHFQSMCGLAWRICSCSQKEQNPQRKPGNKENYYMFEQVIESS